MLQGYYLTLTVTGDSRLVPGLVTVDERLAAAAGEGSELCFYVPPQPHHKNVPEPVYWRMRHMEHR